MELTIRVYEKIKRYEQTDNDEARTRVGLRKYDRQLGMQHFQTIAIDAPNACQFFVLFKVMFPYGHMVL